MTDTVIPPPLDDDDDDVAWALQTAAVQWRRGAKADAVVWLRRAIESALEIGRPDRAAQITAIIAEVEEHLVASVFGGSSPPPADATGSGVDDLLESTVSTARASIDIEFDDFEGERTEILTRGEMLPSDAPPEAESMPTAPAGAMTEPARSRRARPPPAPSSRPPDVAPFPVALPHPGGVALHGVPAAVFTAETVIPSTDSPAIHLGHAGLDEPTMQVPATSPDDLGDIHPSMPLPQWETEDSIHDGNDVEPPLPQWSSDAFPPSEPPPPEPAEQAAEAPPAEPIETETPAAATPKDAEPSIGVVSLATVAGLQDLPPEAQAELAANARIETLDVDEEVSAFAVALVIEGWASIMPAIADVACAFAQAGDVVFTHGTLEDAVALRVVAGETDTRVAVWDRAALTHATADCPWVADELRLVADRFQALGGAAMGPLGDRLDDTLRQSVTDRCEVRTLMAGDEIVQQGKAVPGMFIVGGGTLELVNAEGERIGELGPGEFLFASEVMTAAPAPAVARAGDGGALVLFAARHAAHELMLSVPPLLEILSG